MNAAKLSGKTAKVATKAAKAPQHRIIARNRKAYHDYHVNTELEAGIVLVGSELKPIRSGAVNLSGSYGHLTAAGEAFVQNIHIKEYQQASYTGHQATRTRKLLLKKRQLRKLQSQLKKKGATLIPLEMYFKASLVKIKLGICVGKKLYDKRSALKEREETRKVERFMKTRYLRK